jgi:hypothetical protein
VNRWHVVWRAISKNRLSMATAMIIVIAVVLVAERVMDQGYQFGVQWGQDKRFELAPAR